jgi:RNA polymerase sigma-70 factor (ECF subfamily)
MQTLDDRPIQPDHKQPMNRASPVADAGAGPRKPDPDTELVARCQKGDELALKELYDRHIEGVYAICLHSLKDEARARDCAVDAFAVALRNIGQFRGKSKFFTWLVRITRHSISKVAKALTAERGREVPQPAAVSPERIHDEQQAYIRLVAVMQQLPPDQARIFNLRFLAGLSAEETAQALGISVDAVHSCTTRGRKRLREILRL